MREYSKSRRKSSVIGMLIVAISIIIGGFLMMEKDGNVDKQSPNGNVKSSEDTKK